MAGQREEDVVQARLPDGERSRRQAFAVQDPQRVDQDARPVLGGQAHGLAFAFGADGEGSAEQFLCPNSPALVTHAHLDHGASEVRFQGRRGVVGDDVTSVDHGDPVREPVRLFQVLRGQQDGRP